MPGLLYKEILQTKPLSLVDEAAANLHRTSALLMQEVLQVLATKRVTPKQYNILRILRGAGRKGLACGEIADRLVTPGPDTTRLLDRLVDRRWVAREHDAADRRCVRVHITDKGLETLGALEAPVQKMQAEQFRKLGERRMRTLVGLLELLREGRG